MNHGYCKNCWWWHYEGAIHPARISKEYRSAWESITDKPFPVCSGRCWMRVGDGEMVKMTKETDYCPDYVNRKKEEKKSGTLENFIKKQV